MPRQRYASDLTNEQWTKIEAALPAAKNGRTGRPRTYTKHEVFNAIFYPARTSCAWRHLPHDLPPWNVVWKQFRRWRDAGTLEHVHDALREQVRQQVGKEPTPSAAIIDSQSVKTAQKGGATAMTGARRSKVVSVTSP
jgi:putative transposase